MTSFSSAQRRIAVIYMGGTFGCAGVPLAPLPASIFLPVLHQLSNTHTDSALDFFYTQQIKDSSQLEPQDWCDLIIQLESLRTHDYTHFLIIHGTDTLAYSAACLAEFYQQHAVAIIVTGSQYPLLNADDLFINPHSDAWDNFNFALSTLATIEYGVWVAFHQQYWPALSVQKIHTRDHQAFAGDNLLTAPRKSNIAVNLLPYLSQLPKINLAVLYCTPMTAEQLYQQLKQILATPALDGLILLAFGSGNFPQHANIQALLQSAMQQGVLIVLSTQVVFGGTQACYAAGSWLEDIGIISSQQLPLPALYARILWICCQFKPIAQRKQRFIDLTPSLK
jgi:L-asparaginase